MKTYIKVYYLIKVTSTRIDGEKIYSYYGKKHNEIPFGMKDDIWWYIKEYGYNSESEARKRIKGLSKLCHETGLQYEDMKIVESKVEFPSYEEYLRLDPAEQRIRQGL